MNYMCYNAYNIHNLKLTETVVPGGYEKKIMKNPASPGVEKLVTVPLPKSKFSS